MFSRGLWRSLVLFFIASFITFITIACLSRPAQAAGTGTRTLTPAETRALIGDTIPAKYYNGTDYVDFDFRYNSSSWSVSQVFCESADCLPAVGDTVLLYDHSGSFNVSTDRSFIQVDLYPQYSFFDTTLISQYVGVSTGSFVSKSVYAPPAWRWYTSFQGDQFLYNDWESSIGSGTYANFRMPFDTSHPFDFVQINEESQSTFSAYSYRCLFYGNSAKNGHLYLVVSCPTISDSSTMASGTGGVTTATSSGGSGDINVTVDMTETNSLLGSIIDALHGLVDALAGLFVPSEEALEDFEDSLQTLLEEHLGGLYEANQAVLEYAQSLIDFDITAEDSILFPAIEIPLVGATFRLGPVTVPLVRSEFSAVFDALALVVDIIVTTSFLNMCRRKLILFFHPDGEVITE